MFQGIAIKDNDSLAAMLAANIQADLLILMSDVDGIYNKPPWEDGARLMHTYTSADRNLIQFGKKSKVCSNIFYMNTFFSSILFTWNKRVVMGERILGKTLLCI